MKKLIFALLMTLMCFGITGQTDERKIEVIPTISASGDFDSVALNSELVIASKFHLSGKWNLYGQFGTMYNLYGNKVATERFSEWQLGFEPMVGVGTDRFRVSGFLNSLSIKAWDTGKMPFTEGGVRFSITPWRKVWVSVFGTWPISHPILVNSLYDEFLFEDEGGVYLNKTTTDKWAEQVKSYGANIDFGIGSKIVLGLDGFANDENNYQVGGGLQYQLFKNKPWILNGNVFYTDFENKDYYYIHNIFPGMLENDIQGYTFKVGVSNYGGLGNLNFSNLLGRIAEPTYYSPVKWRVQKNTNKSKINDPFKIDGCTWGGNCLDFQGSLCITSGKAPYKIFVDWGDGTSEFYNHAEAGLLKVNHHYSSEGEYHITVSGMDSLSKTVSYSGQFTARNCNFVDPCALVQIKFSADKDSVNPGKTVNFSWDVKSAEEVTLNDKKVSASVSKYPVVFSTLGKFTYTLKAFNNGKVCKQASITITVIECPAAEVLSLSANPTSGYAPLSATISWVVKNWKTVTLNGENVAGLTNGSGVGSKTFTGILATTDYQLNVGNDCPSNAQATVTVTILECPKAKILDLKANPTEVVSGGATTISWVVENWKTLTLNGTDVTGLTNTSGIGSKTFTNITAATDYVLNAGNDCPSSDTATVKVTIKCEKCKDTNIIIGGSNTDTTRTVTLKNNGCQANTFKIDATGKMDSTTKATKSLTVTLAVGETKVITVKYDKNVTITFDGATIVGVGSPTCVYYLYISANCI